MSSKNGQYLIFKINGSLLYKSLNSVFSKVLFLYFVVKMLMFFRQYFLRFYYFKKFSSNKYETFPKNNLINTIKIFNSTHSEKRSNFLNTEKYSKVEINEI